MSSTRIGFAMCGSFCTFAKSLSEMKKLSDNGYEIVPVMSDNAYKTDTRFGKASDIIAQVEEISGKNIIHTIKSAEPVGPKDLCDIMVIAPCTGNTLSKLCNGITDTAVTMATKSLLRNGKPVVICLATNDALGTSAQNLGRMLNYKNVYFVPFSQDDPVNKPNSLVAHFDLLQDTIKTALDNKQIQPIFR